MNKTNNARGHLKRSVEKIKEKIYKSTRTIMDSPEDVQQMILVSTLPRCFLFNQN